MAFRIGSWPLVVGVLLAMVTLSLAVKSDLHSPNNDPFRTEVTHAADNTKVNNVIRFDPLNPQSPVQLFPHSVSSQKFSTEYYLAMSKFTWLRELREASEKAVSHMKDRQLRDRCVKARNVFQPYLDKGQCETVHRIMIDVGACNFYSHCSYDETVAFFDLIAKTCPKQTDYNLIYRDLVDAYQFNDIYDSPPIYSTFKYDLKLRVSDLKVLNEHQLKTRKDTYGDPVNSGEKDKNLLNYQRALGMVKKEPGIISHSSLNSLIKENILMKCKYTKYTADREREAAKLMSVFFNRVAINHIHQNADDEELLDIIHDLLEACSGTRTLNDFVVVVSHYADAIPKVVRGVYSGSMSEFLTPIFMHRTLPQAYKYKGLATAIVTGIGTAYVPEVFGAGAEEQTSVLSKIWSAGTGMPTEFIGELIEELDDIAVNAHEKFDSIRTAKFDKFGMKAHHLRSGIGILLMADSLPGFLKDPDIKGAIETAEGTLELTTSIGRIMSKNARFQNSLKFTKGVKWAGRALGPVEAILTGFDFVWDGLMKGNVAVSLLKGLALSLQVIGLVLQFIPGAGTLVGTILFAVGTGISFVGDLFVYSPEQDFIKGLGFKLGNDNDARAEVGKMTCTQIANLQVHQVSNLVGQMIDGWTDHRDESNIMHIFRCLRQQNQCEKIQEVLNSGPKTSLKKIYGDFSLFNEFNLKWILKNCRLQVDFVGDDDSRSFINARNCDHIKKEPFFQKRQLVLNLLDGHTGVDDENAIVKLVSCMTKEEIQKMTSMEGTTYMDFKNDVDNHKWLTWDPNWDKLKGYLTPQALGGHDLDWVQRSSCEQLVGTGTDILTKVVDNLFSGSTDANEEGAALKIFECLIKAKKCDRVVSIIHHQSIGVERFIDEIEKYPSFKTRAKRVLSTCQLPTSMDDDRTYYWAKYMSCSTIAKQPAASLQMRIQSSLDGITGSDDSYAIYKIFMCIYNENGKSKTNAKTKEILNMSKTSWNRLKSDMTSAYWTKLLHYIPYPNSDCYEHGDDNEVVVFYGNNGCERRTWGSCSTNRDCKVTSRSTTKGCPHKCYCGTSGVNECRCIRDLKPDSDICNFKGTL